MADTIDIGTVGEAFEKFLLPEVYKALERGATYGDTWLDHIDLSSSYFENVKHVIDIHVQNRILDALTALDYGDVQGFKEGIASAVGYLANAVLKAEYLYRDYRPE